MRTTRRVGDKLLPNAARERDHSAVVKASRKLDQSVLRGDNEPNFLAKDRPKEL